MEGAGRAESREARELGVSSVLTVGWCGCKRGRVTENPGVVRPAIQARRGETHG